MYILYLPFLIFLITLKINLSLEDQCTITNFQNVSNVLANCTHIVIDSLIVPAGQGLVLNLKYGSTLVFRGITRFEFGAWRGPLMVISGINATAIGEKGSVIDGQGQLYWDGQGQWGPTIKPRLLEINAINSSLSGLYIKNCPIACVSVKRSENITIDNWIIDNLRGDEGVASVNKSGHNTDGIGIRDSSNVIIVNSTIFNQDDCVVVNSGNKYIIRNLFCHGSHGFSLSVSNATVRDVIFEDSVIVMAQNGIHVKTHVDSSEGLIKDVTFRNIVMLDCTSYGINVQQNYVNQPTDYPQDSLPKNNVPIRNLTVSHIYGNVRYGAVPVLILCAVAGCFDWTWDEIELFGIFKNNCTNFVPQGFVC